MKRTCAVTMLVDIEASDEAMFKAALRDLNKDPPFKECGTHYVEGWYRTKTRRKATVVERTRGVR